MPAGPRGEQLWASLEELELDEPLLKDSKGNDRRALVIKRARAELAKGGQRGDVRYARAFELLDMLTPTSNYGIWCKLRDELVRLQNDVAYLVGPECELVRIDTLRGIGSDTDLVPKIHEECSRLLEWNESRLSGFERHLNDMMSHVDDRAKRGENVRRYIVDMARFNSGVDDRVALRVILAMYVEQGAYDEACAVCEDIMGFDGEDKARMASSTLVEGVIDRILTRLSGSYSTERDGGTVQRCIRVLRGRSEVLGLNQNPGQGAGLREASRLAFNVLSRRRLRTAEEIDSWIGTRYPLSYAFLNLGDRKLAHMLETSPRLVEDMSAHITCDELIRARQQAGVPDGALDELERLILRLREDGIDTGQAVGDWKGAMRGDSLWGALPEISILLRLRLASHDVELRPPAEDGARMDLRVGDCYVGLLSAADGTPLLLRRLLDSAEAVERSLERILQKIRPASTGNRAIILVADCAHGVFGERSLRDRLASAIAEMPRVAGVLLITLDGGSYRSDFVINPAATVPAPQDTIGMMAGALGARIWRRQESRQGALAPGGGRPAQNVIS